MRKKKTMDQLDLRYVMWAFNFVESLKEYLPPAYGVWREGNVFSLSVHRGGGAPGGTPPQLRGVPPGVPPQLGGPRGTPQLRGGGCPQGYPQLGVPPGVPPPTGGRAPPGVPPNWGGGRPWGYPQLGRGAPGGTPPPPINLDKNVGQNLGQKMDKVLDQKWTTFWTKNWTNILETFGGGGGGRGRYASCGHAGGLSCLQMKLISFSCVRHYGAVTL